jgi:hypothetical protein
MVARSNESLSLLELLLRLNYRRPAIVELLPLPLSFDCYILLREFNFNTNRIVMTTGTTAKRST